MQFGWSIFDKPLDAFDDDEVCERISIERMEQKATPSTQNLLCLRKNFGWFLHVL